MSGIMWYNHDKLIFVIFTQNKLPQIPLAFKKVIGDIFPKSKSNLFQLI